jgi:hypothetical protein
MDGARLCRSQLALVFVRRYSRPLPQLVRGWSIQQIPYQKSGHGSFDRVPERGLRPPDRPDSRTGSGVGACSGFGRSAIQLRFSTRSPRRFRRARGGSTLESARRPQAHVWSRRRRGHRKYGRCRCEDSTRQLCSWLLSPQSAPVVPARLFLRSGFLCFDQIANAVGIHVPDEPDPDGQISLTYQEFLDAVERMRRVDFPIEIPPMPGRTSWAGVRTTSNPPTRWRADSTWCRRSGQVPAGPAILRFPLFVPSKDTPRNNSTPAPPTASSESQPDTCHKIHRLIGQVDLALRD